MSTLHPYPTYPMLLPTDFGFHPAQCQLQDRFIGMLVKAVEGGSFFETIKRLKQAGLLNDGFVVRQPALPCQGQDNG